MTGLAVILADDRPEPGSMLVAHSACQIKVGFSTTVSAVVGRLAVAYFTYPASDCPWICEAPRVSPVLVLEAHRSEPLALHPDTLPYEASVGRAMRLVAGDTITDQLPLAQGRSLRTLLRMALDFVVFHATDDRPVPAAEPTPTTVPVAVGADDSVSVPPSLEGKLHRSFMTANADISHP